MNTRDSDDIVSCFVCERQSIRYFKSPIENYENLSICDTGLSCWAMLFPGCLQVSNIIIQQNQECPVCYEEKTSIRLPNCEHTLCMDCFRKVYFGYSTMEKPLSRFDFPKEEDDAVFPYDDANKKEEWEDYSDKLYDGFCIEVDDSNRDRILSLDELLEMRDASKEERKEWMNTPIFMDYEIKYLQYWRNACKRDDASEDFHDDCDKNLRTQCCPLCRM